MAAFELMLLQDFACLYPRIVRKNKVEAHKYQIHKISLGSKNNTLHYS